MSEILKASEVKRLAGLELNDLVFTENLPSEVFGDSRVSSAGTPIYDTSGEVLFHRVPLRKGRAAVGYVDIAVNPALGGPYLSASYGYEWNPQNLTKEAVAEAKKKLRNQRFDKHRFVAYSYPKIAMQFLSRGTEVLMLELYTWQPVPEERATDAHEPPSNFERWSLLKEIPPAQKQSNIRSFQKRMEQWNELCPPDHPPRGFKPESIRVKDFEGLVRRPVILPKVKQREIHYSPENTDHHPCYELRSQITNVWCVAGSVQMLLDFYRYNYAQTRIATELRLGTMAHPNGLPYGRVGDVVTVVEKLTGKALNVTMNRSPKWAEFYNEINDNRPLISFIPGHSRTVAGYTIGPSIHGGNFRGLLVYDPWPPSPSAPPTPHTGGTIRRWENFDASTYFITYTAKLKLY